MRGERAAKTTRPVKGHDFSRAAKTAISTWALAPAGLGERRHPTIGSGQLWFRSVLENHIKRPSQEDVAGNDKEQSLLG